MVSLMATARSQTGEHGVWGSGSWVEVRSKNEILQTLDKNGMLEGMPFMPQMFKYCGRQFQIYKSAHKTCDTITGAYVARKLSDGIHLNLRCDGEAYDGCQAGCLIFWKMAWLKPVSGKPASAGANAANDTASCTEADVVRATKLNAGTATSPSEIVYSCQTTRLIEFTRPYAWYDVRQYIEDYRTGNETLGSLLRGFLFSSYYYGTLSFRGWPGAPGRWLYDAFAKITGSMPFPKHKGLLPAGVPAPASDLGLRPGDLVRVKSFEEILKTIDARNVNRGMVFDSELVPYCGKTFRVRLNIDRFIDEKSGRMKSLKTPAVILEDVYCKGRFSTCRMFCPRSIYSWWREVWLERVEG